MIKGFRDFLLRGNVVDLAVAVIIGAAFGKIVTALVEDILTPLIGVVGGTPDFSGLSFTVNKAHFKIGDFLNALIAFLMIAAAIYFFVVVPMNRIMARLKRGERVDPAEKACPECLSLIPVKARRCKFCTVVVGK